MEALFVVLWFAVVGHPEAYQPKYFAEPVPRMVCGQLAIRLQMAWHADGATCLEKPPEGAEALPGTLSPDRYASARGSGQVSWSSSSACRQRT